MMADSMARLTATLEGLPTNKLRLVLLFAEFLAKEEKAGDAPVEENEQVR